MTTLTTTEQSELQRCEEIIKRGMTTFVEVGSALLTISDGRLYRETHSTFDAYVTDVWNMTARRAYQLCEAATVVKQLKAEGGECEIISQNLKSTHAAELAKVPKEKRAKVIKAITTSGEKVTAQSIAAAAKEPEVNRIEVLQHQAKEAFSGLEIPSEKGSRVAIAKEDFDIMVAEHTKGMTYQELDQIETHLDVLRRKVKAMKLVAKQAALTA